MFCSVVPARKPWTPVAHELWIVKAQLNVHKAVAVLWKVRKYYPQMYMPYELVEIILRHTVEPPVSPLPPKVTVPEHFDSDEDFEFE
jgi:hypothetical protein